MVEGPGCTLNGEKIRSKVQKGQKVLEMRGAAGSALSGFVGCTYSGVQSLGKELFIYFGLRALRLHFGMNGSLRINQAEGREDGQRKWTSLVIRLTKDTVCFFDCTVEIRLTEDCEEKVRLMCGLDVCSPTFSTARGVEVVRQESDRMLCDALLDQSVLPGVGNIIKNEALLDSGLHPGVKVKLLTAEQVQHVVKMTRDFSLLFYQCRKRGSALQRHCRVYKRSSCGQCGGNVTVCRLGSDSRMTYFCPRCQTEDPGELDVSKLPARSALLRWTARRDEDVDLIAKKEEEEWTCDLCTLINRPISRLCEACLSPRPERRTEEGDLAPLHHPSSSPLILYPCNSFSKPQEVKLQRRAAFGNTTLVLTRLGPKPSAAPADPPGGGTNTPDLQPKRSSAAITGTPATSASPKAIQQPCKRRRTEMQSGPCAASNGTQTCAAPSSSPAPPCCPTHRRAAALRVVTKAGENKGRPFYTCSLPRDKQCTYFEWADRNFPTCHHGKRTLKRTVLKLGPNNGRDFYVCPLQQGAQCDFFQWVECNSGIAAGGR